MILKRNSGISSYSMTMNRASGFKSWLKNLHITNLFVWLLDTGGHWVGFAQGRERPGPEVCDGRWDYSRDGVFGQRSVTAAVGSQQTEGAGGRKVSSGWVLAQRLLWNTEEMHAEEDAPGQRREEEDDLVLGAQQLTHERVTPVHSSHQVTTRSTQACTAQR